MSQSTETTRPDPLLDAYRQASAHEGARASANVRAAVLAHARVVAQSSNAAAAATGLTGATRATPAANDSKPIWRLAAGVVIGLVGVWIFQLTRPAATIDATVAVVNSPSVLTAPLADKARTAESANTVTPASPEPTKPEATVAVAERPVAKESAAKRASPAGDPPVKAARSEQNLAAAKALAANEKTDRPAAFTGGSVAAAPAAAARAAPAAAPPVAATAAAASAADESVAAMGSELVIAAADTRKSARLQSRTEAPSPALAMPAPPPAAAPNAFPAQASGVAVAAAPAARPPPANAAAPARAVASGASSADDASPVRLSEPELAMFNAVRAGDVPALRSAITRGVNVNVKDERGRTALHVARERGDVATIKLLESAGAR